MRERHLPDQSIINSVDLILQLPRDIRIGGSARLVEGGVIAKSVLNSTLTSLSQRQHRAAPI